MGLSSSPRAGSSGLRGTDPRLRLAEARGGAGSHTVSRRPVWPDQVTRVLVHLPLWLALLPAGCLPWEPGQLQACPTTPAPHNSPAPQKSPLPHSSGSIWSLWRWPVSRAGWRQQAHPSGSGAAGHVGQRGPMGPVAPYWREGRGCFQKKGEELLGPQTSSCLLPCVARPDTDPGPPGRALLAEAGQTVAGGG